MGNVRVLIGLGSNIEPRAEYISRAVEALGQVRGASVERVSANVASDPLDCPPGSGPFLNAVLLAHTSLTPHALLDHLLAIEKSLGRDRAGQVANAPRTIDLDLLIFGDMQINDDRLRVPHPRMKERAFVLDPLLEISPQEVDPETGRPLKEFRGALGDAGR